MEKGEENADDEEETTLSKVDEKSEFKGKDRLKDKDDKGKKKETRTCNHCGMKGHIEVNLSTYRPESFDGIVKNKLPGKLFFFLTHQKFLCIVRTCFVHRGVAIYR